MEIPFHVLNSSFHVDAVQLCTAVASVPFFSKMAECYPWNCTGECSSTLQLWWLGGSGGMLNTRAHVCGERSQVGFDMVECILIEIQRRRFTSSQAA
jgi:hypothetical protein